VARTTLLSLEHSGGSLEEVGEIGSRLGTELEEGVINMGVIGDEGKFKVT
jgi:hypothetical protein